MNTTKKTAAGLIVLAAVIIGGFLVVGQEDTAQTTPNKITSPGLPVPGDTTSEPDPQTVLLIGDPSAKLTIIKYGDFQCPFCKEFFEDTEPAILSNYVDTGQAKIEFRVETHIGRESIRAGEAAYCANDQSRFRQYHDQLYKRQSGYNGGTFSDPNLKRIAADLKLDQASFDACLDSKKYQSLVEASNDEAKQNGITATPTLLIGERRVSGAQPFSIYKPLIDAQL